MASHREHQGSISLVRYLRLYPRAPPRPGCLFSSSRAFENYVRVSDSYTLFCSVAPFFLRVIGHELNVYHVTK